MSVGIRTRSVARAHVIELTVGNWIRLITRHRCVCVVCCSTLARAHASREKERARDFSTAGDRDRVCVCVCSLCGVCCLCALYGIILRTNCEMTVCNWYASEQSGTRTEYGATRAPLATADRDGRWSERALVDPRDWASCCVVVECRRATAG